MDLGNAQWEILQPVFGEAASDRWETGGYGGRPNKGLNGCYRVLRTRHSARSAEPLPAVSNLPSAVSAMAAGWPLRSDFADTGQGSGRTRGHRSERRLHRRLLQRGQKGGSGVGKTKRGKGTKIMAVADRHGLPMAVHIESATPHEVKLAVPTLVEMVIPEAPQNLAVVYCERSSKSPSNSLK